MSQSGQFAPLLRGPLAAGGLLAALSVSVAGAVEPPADPMEVAQVSTRPAEQRVLLGSRGGGPDPCVELRVETPVGSRWRVSYYNRPRGRDEPPWPPGGTEPRQEIHLPLLVPITAVDWVLGSCPWTPPKPCRSGESCS